MRRLVAFILLAAASAGGAAAAGVAVESIDLLEPLGIDVNAAGPVLVRMDRARGRLIAANTLSSSLTVIDCATGAVRNIPVAGRAYQHLKAESMAIDPRTGDVCLIGVKRFFIVSPALGTALAVPTGAQYESIAVDPATGNVFLAGRESAALGFHRRGTETLTEIDWLRTSEPLVNLNATPPPPIRKVLCDGRLGSAVAVDGFTSTLRLFDAATGADAGGRDIPLPSGGRWHLAGYREDRHELYLVAETPDRRVVKAARVAVAGGNDLVVDLPGFTEGVGIVYDISRDEVYIPYDNHASVHVVDFGAGGELTEIAIPAYGNDASAVDAENGLLYIGSWAFGEIDVVDLVGREFVRRWTGLGIIPHMFTMEFDPEGGRLYFPRGASAVNGTFGAAVCVFDPSDGSLSKIRTGWAPIELIEDTERSSVLVFSSEDQFAEITRGTAPTVRDLPFDYPIAAVRAPRGDIYLSYGPHQSYWPTVYIRGAKNGILAIDAGDLSFYDRRIPRQALDLALGANGVLYFTQNNWGREEQFVGRLVDRVRVFEPGQRLRLGEEVERETTQRLLEFDPGSGMLYLVRTGERDDEPSVLSIVDPAAGTVAGRVELGLTATDIVFDAERVYVSNFDSKTVSIVEKRTLSVEHVEAGDQPLRLLAASGRVLALCHGDNTVVEIGGRGTSRTIPFDGRPDNIFEWNGAAVISTHSDEELHLLRYDPEHGRFDELLCHGYPYGDVSYDTDNVSFYMRGQFGDAVFEITRGITAADGSLWVADFLAGKLFVLREE